MSVINFLVVEKKKSLIWREVVNALLIDTWFQNIVILIFKNTVIGNSNALIMQLYM